MQKNAVPNPGMGSDMQLEEGEGKGEGGFLTHHVKCGKVSVLYFTCGASHHF